ncbi:hypothetical protein EJ994_17185 [Maribacter sp. MJ134]|uniref:hypothetical protein n=1 Tax=Maribacter sp. MJ134 TaxID=2496865 RepID=UPI000F847F20|nr:hypothetical protein [Maribacter sp. MJ134]AZQ60444.1 hypothetical protein EJ994_17185 [Maribacter sp. MJ134]
MATKFKLKGLDFPYEFELDNDGFIWLMDYEMKGSKTNLGQTEGGIKDLKKAEKLALEMIKGMGII